MNIYEIKSIGDRIQGNPYVGRGIVIGKSEVVDGTISYNRMISRAHCRINKDGSLVTITDLQSSNGTYVNQTKLQPNQPCQLQNGDIIRLANSDFQVSIV